MRATIHHLYVILPFDNLTHGDDMGEGKGFFASTQGEEIMGQIRHISIEFQLPPYQVYIYHF